MTPLPQGNLDNSHAHVNHLADRAALYGPNGQPLWNPAGEETARLRHTGKLSGVAIAPDSSGLATIGGDNSVRIWDRTSEQTLTMMRTDGALLDCDWTLDGSARVLATR